MKINNSVHFFFATLLLVSMLECGTQVAGGASDTEVSASISGSVSNVRGNPVASAVVSLRPVDYLPGDELISDTTGQQSFDGTTDSEGMFSAESLVKGVYILEILSGDSIGTLMEVIVDTAIMVTAIVEPLGIVSGNVDMYSHPATFGKTSVAFLGTEHWLKPDSNGVFTAKIPSGKYRMRLRADTAEVDDIVVVFQLKPDQVHDFGIIRLVSPSHPCMNYQCDSQIVRTLLDDAGYEGSTVEEVTGNKNGRISELKFRGLPLGAVSLAPLAQLTAVEIIDLGNTGISDSCTFIENMWHLEMLIVDSNSISGLPEEIGRLKELKKIDISYNSLTDLPMNIVKLRPWSLNVEGNSLCEVSEGLEGWISHQDPQWRDTQNCP